MIDLHSHTDHSDGTSSPAELVEMARAVGLSALAITDHDTVSGYDEAAPSARGLELIPGIEITCKHGRDNVHLLGYFLHGDPGAEFRDWLKQTHEHRKERNRRLVARLNELGVDIRLEDVEAMGRIMTGRPHFARLLVAKGYAANFEDAFRRYLGEHAPAFVERQGPGLEEAVERIRAAGGLSSLAHPVRVEHADEAAERAFFDQMADCGLSAVEAFHTDHSEADTRRYLEFADYYGFGVTGGSDFHGSNKSGALLGVPRVDEEWLRKLRG